MLDFVNIIGTLYDNSISHIIALAHQIKDLRLGKNQQEINEDVYDKLSDLNQLDNKVEELSQQNISLDNRVSTLEKDEHHEGVSDNYKHKVMTKSQYDALESYERNTIYLIVDLAENSVFGDTFPFILGGDSGVITYSQLGDKFPFTLGG